MPERRPLPVGFVALGPWLLDAGARLEHIDAR